jgi:phospholipid/cholesterol/gamma-HCH transport system substrate-binding protein
MAKQTINNVKLGVFVIAGLVFLVLLLYMIGKNRNLFGSTYELKARFENVHGLVAGNNVRFSGIEAGTVKRISILSDTVIEVTMLIQDKMKTVIRQNAIASIATDGLVGNKVVNIVPARSNAPLAEEGWVIASKKAVNTEEMLETLYKTNNDVAIIAAGLKSTVQRINSSSALWTLLNEKSIPTDIKASAKNIHAATSQAVAITEKLNEMVSAVKKGEGSLGVLLTDTSFARNLDEAVNKIKQVGIEADSLAVQIGAAVEGVKADIDNGKGAVTALLKDSALVIKLNNSLDNIQKGTDGFNQNMEALKHNFLFRGYFRRLEKQKAREKQ